MKIKKIGIVSLSSGIIGEDVVKHEIEIGVRRLEQYGVEAVFLPNAQKGLAYLNEHPEARAQDLLDAFADDSIDLILCAIGGLDTHRLLPYLFDHDELKRVVKQKPFLGFSDTTKNHLMLHKLGIKTFYGQAFLCDICEIADEMLPYTKQYFEELLETGAICAIRPSAVWYAEREDFSEAGVGVPAPSFPNRGFELLSGSPIFEGEILGGCLESIYDILDNTRHESSADLCSAYDLFPSLEEWRGKILLLETSENRPEPELFRTMLRKLVERGLFDVIAGVLVGKPQNEAYYEEYKQILFEEIPNRELPILYNLNVGHATPRCIVPFGVKALVNADEQIIRFENEAEHEIAKEHKKTEEHIDGASTGKKHKQKNRKTIIRALAACLILPVLMIGASKYRTTIPQNVIVPVSENSTEMQAIKLLTEPDGSVHFYEFKTTDEYKALRLYYYEYGSGDLLKKEHMEINFDAFGSPKSGQILIFQDFANFQIKTVIATEHSKVSTQMPILEDLEARAYYGRSSTRIEGETEILYDMEEPLLGLIYDNDEMRMLSVYDIASGKTDMLKENDYVYLISYEFCKA